MKFSKYQALGNDYLTIKPAEWHGEPGDQVIRRVCDRHYGAGADGILYGPLDSDACDFRLQIFNPDGSEAEKSGNGLRIFSRYLWDLGLVQSEPFSIETKGGAVEATVLAAGGLVSVRMGVVKFAHSNRDNACPDPERLAIEDQRFEFFRANVGNPHCVIPMREVSAALASKYGPLIERNPLFPDRTNVQFLQVVNRKAINIQIWERGAGYTLASGSSSVASAAVAHALGLCDNKVTVSMPGGLIDISFDHRLMATMTGTVGKVCEGILSVEALE